VTGVLDLRVTIERVRVRTGVLEASPRPAFAAGGTAAAAPGNHRIVIHELCIDVEAEIDATRARALGKDVARDLAGKLAELQDERRPDRADAQAPGPIHVETLRLYLRGDPERHPSSHEICAALMTAFEQRVLHAT
jgi:hypothetical protein